MHSRSPLKAHLRPDLAGPRGLPDLLLSTHSLDPLSLVPLLAPPLTRTHRARERSSLLLAPSWPAVPLHGAALLLPPAPKPPPLLRPLLCSLSHGAPSSLALPAPATSSRSPLRAIRERLQLASPPVVAASCLHLRCGHGAEDQQLCPPSCASPTACLYRECLVESMVCLGPTIPFACTTD